MRLSWRVTVEKTKSATSSIALSHSSVGVLERTRARDDAHFLPAQEFCTQSAKGAQAPLPVHAFWMSAWQAPFWAPVRQVWHSAEGFAGVAAQSVVPHCVLQTVSWQAQVMSVWVKALYAAVFDCAQHCWQAWLEASEAQVSVGVGVPESLTVVLESLLVLASVEVVEPSVVVLASPSEVVTMVVLEHAPRAKRPRESETRDSERRDFFTGAPEGRRALGRGRDECPRSWEADLKRLRETVN